MNASATSATGSRILVVDDEPSIVDAVATALRYEGFEVREALTGRDAIAEAQAFDPELVVAVAEAHGGAVSVRSTPGEGATFVIDLPLPGIA